MDSDVEFDAESDGAKIFLKKGAQSAHFGPNRGPDGFLSLSSQFHDVLILFLFSLRSIYPKIPIS